jgi:TRAP-type C4-dicarboxylate transport system permease small subunit
MKASIVRILDAVYLACIVVSAIALIVMTLVIPYGVFMRYVMNNASAWPEPLSVLMMILFSFFGGAACYRANAHISVMLLSDALPQSFRKPLAWFAEACMAGISLFMLYYGWLLAQQLMNQMVAEFPFLKAGVTYLPIPIGGLITLLFIAERVFIGPPPPDSIVYREPASTS